MPTSPPQLPIDTRDALFQEKAILLFPLLPLFSPSTRSCE